MLAGLGAKSDAEMARRLINARHLPVGMSRIIERSSESHAYHDLTAYPKYWFRDWKQEERGPLPACLPIARTIVRKSATWLFGKPLAITVPGNELLQDLLEDCWELNRMPVRAKAMAERAGLEGGICLKFSWDPESVPSVRIQALDLMLKARLYYHPHDCERLLMGRVQYPYWDAARGKTFYYREEWTDELEVHYRPVDAALMFGLNPDAYEGWEVISSDPNPFGVIPMVHIRNREMDDTWGMGDLWDLYRVLDRIHLTYHLMDRSNQFDSDINEIFIDAELDPEDIDHPLQPGQARSLRSAPDSNKEAKVVFPPTGNALRPAMMEYAKDLRKQIHSSIGMVEVDQAEFTNKGNMTQAVLAQLYNPLIELTDEKRKTFGDAGLVPFFQRMARGLQNIGVPLGVTDDDESYTPVLKWGAYFVKSEDEKAAYTARLKDQVQNLFVPHSMAVEEISEMEDRDLTEVEDGLSTETAPIVTNEPDPNAATLQTEKGIGGSNAQ